MLGIVDILEMADKQRKPGGIRKGKVEDMGVLYIVAIVFFFCGMTINDKTPSNLCYLVSVIASVILLIAHIVQHEYSTLIVPIIIIIANLASFVIKRI